MTTSLRSYIAEFIGTAVLVIGGVGTAVLDGKYVSHVGVSLAFGLALLVLVYSIGPISGCHVNPAVTLGLLAVGKIKVNDAVGYIISQLLGGIAGAALIFAVVSGRPGYSRSVDGLAANGYGAHSPDGFNLGSGFLIEVLMTFLLLFVVLAATDRLGTAALAGVAIGFTLTLIHLVSIPVTNTSVNPARSLGPALFAGGGALGQLWLFIVAPIIGGVLGALCYKALWGGAAADDEPVLDVPAGR